MTTSSGGSAAPGNFYPTIVRFPAGIGQSMIAAGYKITIMEHDWSLKLKTYQGQEYAYVVDDNDKPVVFNPSLYAQTDIQTKKLNNGKFPLTIKGPNGEKLGGKDEMLSVASGLLIYGPTGATAKGYLNSKLTHLAEPTYPRVLGRAEGASLYSPEKGQDLGHLDNDVETEIVWRYVNTTDTVVIFNSYQEMQKDIEYRKTLCNLVQTKIDPEFGISDAANGEKWNSAAGAATLNYGPRNGITWRSALEDVFIEHFDESNTLVQKYLLGCQSTAACLHLLAYMNTFGEAAFMQQIGKATPKGFRGDPSDNRLLDFTAYTYVVPQQGDNRAHWIPGDWGYIRNAHPPAGDDGTHAGEHIIYVGGCFIKTYTQFQNNALFFGHRLPSDNYQPGQTHKPRIIKTLGEWIGAFADASPTGNQSTVKQP